MNDKELASALRTVISGINKRLRKKATSADSLSISEFGTLSYLNLTESRSPSELAELLKVTGQSMSEILARLQARDIVSRTPSPTDKRKFLISLTPHGRHLVEQTRYERDEWLTSAIAGQLTGAEKKTLEKAIVLIERLSDFE